MAHRRRRSDRGEAMRAVIKEIYDGGKDPIAGWTRLEQATNGLRWSGKPQAVRCGPLGHEGRQGPTRQRGARAPRAKTPGIEAGEIPGLPLDVNLSEGRPLG